MRANFNRPQLFIIAGANGAGKSSISKSLLQPFDLVAFDWDQEFYSKWSKFGFDPVVEQGVRDATSNLFRERIGDALNKETDFAFETNFHSSGLMEIANEFKSSGFEINLYFLLVSEKQVCKDRVKYRVSEEKGHFVSEATIEKRFVDGLNILDSNFEFFDRVTIFDTSYHLHAKLIAAFEFGALRLCERNLPQQVVKFLPNLEKTISSSNAL